MPLGAGDGIRTHDNNVGNVVLCQLSYTRKQFCNNKKTNRVFQPNLELYFCSFVVQGQLPLRKKVIRDWLASPAATFATVIADILCGSRPSQAR